MMTPFFIRLALVASLIALLFAIAASGIGTLLPRSQWIPLSLRTYEGAVRIYLFDVGHDLLTYLTDNARSLQAPALSPDGRTIAYLAADDGDLMMKLDTIPGGNPVPEINFGYGNSPSWSPDGSQIAFADGSSNADIYVVNLNDQSIYRMTDNLFGGGEPAWSPDSEWIVYAASITSASDLYVMDARCAAHCDSNAAPLTQGGDYYFPSWSPQGKQIAYLYDVGRGNSIYLLDTDCLYERTDCLQETPQLVLSGNITIFALHWSADSQQIIFTAGYKNHLALFAASAACRDEPTCQPTPLEVLNPPPGLRW